MKKITFYTLILIIGLLTINQRTFNNLSLYKNNPAEHFAEPNVVPKTFVFNSRFVLAAKSVKIENPQYILLSFDGSRNLQMWEDSRTFARKMNESGIPVAFTYFISGVYFLPYTKAGLYRPPNLSPGSSLIGFADSPEEIPLRIEEVRNAVAEGHEIGSHLNGHFQGGGLWDKSGWLSELIQFNKLLTDAGINSGNPEINFPEPKNIKGLRTPNLSKNKSLYPALEEANYFYDSSQVGQPEDQPYKIGSIWEIPLKNIPLDGTNQEVISMDYNFYSRQSDAKDIAKKGTALYDKFYRQTLNSYVNYFNQVYNGNRSPMVIGHHFSLWNDGVYWEAMQEFIKQICGKPDVLCATFSQYVSYLNSK